MNKKAARIIVLTLTVLLLPFTSFTGWVQARPNSEETRGTVLYVSSGGSGACTSWADTCDLQAALTAAIATDEIWVQAGTYLPTNTTDRTKSFVLKNGVAIYGGFAGTETARDQRDWLLNLTILSGEIGNPAIITDNAYNVLYGYQLDVTTILDGFTITSGNANGNFSNSASGGGMYNNDSSSPTLTNLIFSNNSAGRGGGMYNVYLSNPTMTNVSFSSNTASEYGGGIYNSSGCNLTLAHASFSNNSANYGGGMHNDGSSPIMTNVTFSGNTASVNGGGIYNNSNSNPTLTNVALTGNTAVEDGGGMYNSYSSPTLANVTFSSNSTSLKGGGMFNSYSSPTMVNTTFSGNTASTNGGGIYNRSSSNLTLANVTFTGNTAYGSGGGMYNSFGCNTTVTNAIFWGNSPNQVFRDPGTVVITYSDIQGGYTGEGNINLDPLLSPLSDNDGFTLTHALLPGSPAIDTGSPSVCPATDQRGYVRPVDGDGNGSSICDMGAFEFGSGDIHGTVFYVSNGGTGKCTSWADTCNPQAALTAAIAPDEIWVEAGTYLPTETADRTISFLLKDGVALYGGFAGTETALDKRDLNRNPTILSGDIGVKGDTSDNSYNVVYGSGLSATTILDGFIITAGNADGISAPSNAGGGLHNTTSSSPTVTNVTFSNNSAISGGGISNTSNSNPTLTNVTFSGNSANYGGSMYNNNSSPILTNVTFSGNTASKDGGGIYNTTNSAPTLINAILWGNLPDQVYNNSSTPVITYSDIQGGYAGTCNINLDPLLGPLADNGGFTLTHMLLPGSPAIDTGSPSVCPATDQRGYVRPVDGDGNGSAICDMGAFEALHIIFVDEDAHGLNNGESWSNAFTDLQDALEIANSADHIWVADGTYLPTGTTDRTKSFVLKNGVAIYGGFSGTETTLKQRDFVSNLTILSGDIGVTGNTSDNSYHVVYGLQIDATAILDGFIITSGNGNGSNPPDDLGGGMYNAFESSPTLTNLIFSNNSAWGGGGIYNYIDSSPILTNITFSNNSASYGGGMFNHSANPSLTNVTFSGNPATIEGGGIINFDSNPTLTNVTFSNNLAENGGGMSNFNNSSPSLINVTIVNNSATLGGGIYNITNSNPTLTNVILWSNSIGQVFNDGTSTPTITYSDVQGGYTGTGNIDLDPLLGALADNGGYTQTHSLGAGSPAIDAGSPSICPDFDQRGYGRPIDGDMNGSLICDIGAYEYDPFTYIFIPLIIR